MFYRAQQFFQAILPKKIRLEEFDWVHKILPSSALPLFFAQSLPDQRHALDVALDINSSNRSSHNLLIAALLHDCGKSRNPLKTWERIYIVLAQQAPRKVWNFLLHSTSFLSSPLLTAENHPAWGSEFAHKAGLDPEIVELIRLHHCPKTSTGRILYEADNRH
jgi:hypothetical protein